MIERIGEGMSGRSWAVPERVPSARSCSAPSADGDWAAGRGSRGAPAALLAFGGRFGRS